MFFRTVLSANTLVRWVNENAFASVLQARPCPTFGRPVHLRGGPHRLRPGTSPHALRIPSHDGHPALRGFTPRPTTGLAAVFGYDAPHLSARGTLTLPNNALLSAQYQRIRLPLWHLPFSGIIHIVRHTRFALSADQDHNGSPRSHGASLFARAVLPDPAAVSGHLAICGVPTGACQPLRYCRPAVMYLTRLNSFTFVTARASLCLRLGVVNK